MCVLGKPRHVYTYTSYATGPVATATVVRMTDYSSNLGYELHQSSSSQPRSDINGLDLILAVGTEMRSPY